jgi:uncharacterized protein YcfL
MRQKYSFPEKTFYTLYQLRRKEMYEVKMQEPEWFIEVYNEKDRDVLIRYGLVWYDTKSLTAENPHGKEIYIFKITSQDVANAFKEILTIRRRFEDYDGYGPS